MSDSDETGIQPRRNVEAIVERKLKRRMAAFEKTQAMKAQIRDAQVESSRIAKLALVVLEGCGARLNGGEVELHDGAITYDTMTVRGFQELKAVAATYGHRSSHVREEMDEQYAMERSRAEAGWRASRDDVNAPYMASIDDDDGPGGMFNGSK